MQEGFTIQSTHYQVLKLFPAVVDEYLVLINKAQIERIRYIT